MAKLREMAACNLAAVMDLARRSPGAPHWPRQIYENAMEQEQTAALVAVDGDKLAGFALGTLVLDVCQLESIIVAEEFRRQGIGGTLLQAIIDWSRQCSAQRMELEVRAGNTAAIALYERIGFLRDGVRRSYYRDPQEDALLMGLALDLHAKRWKKIPEMPLFGRPPRC
jgi:[ribosomal protein S18]-alanine N-acetyltransferase